MRAVQSTLALILFVVSSAVGGRVCYTGQEPVPNSHGLYRWVLDKISSAECIKFRLGGVNTKCHGGDQDLSNFGHQMNDGPRGNEYEMEGSNTSACAMLTTDNYWAKYPTQGYFNSSLERLEFTDLLSGSHSIVILRDRNTPLYSIAFFPGSSQIDYLVAPFAGESTPRGVGLPCRVWIAREDGEVQVGRVGSHEPLLRLNETSRQIWSVEFSSSQPAEWHIYMPCY